MKRGRRAVRPATANAATRAVVYHRVSSEERVEGYSLAHGWTVAEEYRDEGKSAWTEDLEKRPAFAWMVADAEAGLIDVVVVHKLDRFSRNPMVTLETL